MDQSAAQDVGGPKVLLFAHHKCDSLNAISFIGVSFSLPPSIATQERDQESPLFLRVDGYLVYLAADLLWM